MALTANQGVDAVIEVDFAANAKLMPRLLRPRGTVVIYGTGAVGSEIPEMFFLRNAITLRYIYVYELNAIERTATLRAIARALEQGSLRTIIGKSFPLSEIVAAHEAVEQGSVLGNVVIELS